MNISELPDGHKLQFFCRTAIQTLKNGERVELAPWNNGYELPGMAGTGNTLLSEG